MGAQSSAAKLGATVLRYLELFEGQEAAAAAASGTKRKLKRDKQRSPLPMIGKGITRVKGTALFDRPSVHLSPALYT